MKSWFLQPASKDSINRKIFRAVLMVGLLTEVVKAAATVKELI